MKNYKRERKTYRYLLSETRWPFLEIITREKLIGKVTTFRATKSMAPGDLISGYLTKKGLRETGDTEHLPGVYLLAEITSDPPEKMLEPTDPNFGQLVVKAKIIAYNTRRPFPNCEDLTPRDRRTIVKCNKFITERFERGFNNFEHSEN